MKKQDNFSTKIETVEQLLNNYIPIFNNKIIYCNCNDNVDSPFFKYFNDNFLNLNLNKLITTVYELNVRTYKIERNRDSEELILTKFKSNGDFRNQLNVIILPTVDIVVTSPPTSLVLFYIEQLIEYDKKFILLVKPESLLNSLYISNLFSNDLMYYGYTAQELIKETPIVEGFNYSTYLKLLNELTELEIEYGIIDLVVWITNL